jgi:hypothetical protein
MTVNAQRSLRLIPRTDFSRLTGNRGEIFYDPANNTLRVFDSQIQGGISLARADLNNVSDDSFRKKSVESDVATVAYTVTVSGPQSPDTGNKYQFNGVYKPQPTWVVGYTYVFVQDDPTNVFFPNANGTTANPHPLNFSSDNLSGERGGGTSYLANVRYFLNSNAVTQAVYNSSAFNTATSRQVWITITNSTPATLYYWCWNHMAMGNSATVADPGTGSGANTTTTITNNNNIENPFKFSVAGNDSTLREINNGESIKFLGAGGVTVTTDSEGNVTITGSANTGNITFNANTISSQDSSSITVTPQTQFRSNVLVDGDITLTGQGLKRILNVEGGNIEFTDNITVNPKTGSDFIVDTYNGATHYQWKFDSAGDLIFPDNTVQTTAYTGNVGSINLLVDVDTATTPPVVGQVLKWNGTNWVPAADATVGGAGTDADTLDGLDSSYFLNFANLSNKPNIFITIAVGGQSSVVADSVTDTLTLVAGTGLSITTNAGTDTITITNTVTDTNTTYAVSAETATGGVNLRLTGSDAVTDDVKFAQGSNITLTRTDANTITIASSFTDTNTTYSISAETNAAGADIRLTGSDAATDNLTIAAGTNVTVTRTDANTITIASTASGGTASDSFATIAVAGQTNVVADSSTDTLTLAAGTGISITTNASTDTVTIASTVTAGATAFTGLSDAAGLTVDKFYLPAITRLDVTNNLSSSYRFDQYGTTDNPAVYAINGTTIAFNLNVMGHPFLIRTSGGTNYNTGLVHVSTTGTVLTGAAAQGQMAGTLYWKIPTAISGQYQYICSVHGAMVGVIEIKAFSAI